MPTPSPFPRWRFSKALDALICVLRDDPLLSRTVKTWKTWDGSRDDAAPPEPLQMPWARITPTVSPIDFATEADYEVDFAVQIELAVNTTDVRHMLDFWGAVVAALVGEKSFRGATVRDFLRDEGDVVTYRVSRTGGTPAPYPPRNPQEPPATPHSLTSSATVSLLLYVPA